MVETPTKGKPGQFDSSRPQGEPLPTKEIKELVADMKNLRLSFFQSFDLQVNKVDGSFDTKISKGDGISNTDFREPALAFSESNSKKHGGKYVDQRGSGNLVLGEAVAVAYNEPGREPVFMMRGKMGTDGVGRPNPTTFVIKFNNHESVQKLEQLISTGGVILIILLNYLNKYVKKQLRVSLNNL
ncbi:MAG: hypothetical protein UR63_C0043G0019 [Candidatus Roizmanbacteria bacterium GW2011_GWC2_35_12]|uniref:Uncharacterized protein n=2 Tax=Candidatus Roizmaniibacteriota TaxID=1752723 RepID=A0A0G0C0I9_9BACT|nr:MAG: hypothetical protein UR23_C0013G0003 [Candidatus Roizmanbacteria bacterium GW2011_GWA2_32_13]KKP65824.1 MAG: hypothetical protein UR63_C0043G0019 [Candidatus Roizmanbacteria bacterium GW2011_GWC2_35_12]